MALAHLEVLGRVQGVGFRWFVKERARRLGLVGWVRNRADGAVEILAQGPEDAIATLRHDVAEGPPGARVREVRSLPADATPLAGDTFSVIR